MKSSKYQWISRVIGYVLTAAFVLVMVFGLLDIARKDRLIDPDDESQGEALLLERTELGDPAFELITENEAFSLYADKRSGEIALYDRARDHMWYSNPQDRNTDVLSYDKTVPASQILVNYLNVETNLDTQIGSMYGSAQVSAVTCETIENGIRFTFSFPEFGFVVPVAYRLEKDGFSAEIDCSLIQETMVAQYKLMSVALLPFFGAGGTQDEGYLFVPDGSGALINYNNGRQSSAAYSAFVYGADSVVPQKTLTGISEEARLPVFGLKTNEVASLSVITSGEAMGQICASVSGQGTGYNRAYAQMVYRRREITSVEKGSKTYNMSQFSECLLDEPFTVRYFMLYGEQADYSGMAQQYRTYLVDNDLIRKSELIDDYSMLVELYGAVKKEESEFSIRSDTVLPLTTYRQAAELLEKLRSAGVNTTLSLKGWNTGGMGGAAPDTLTPEKVLGGQKDFTYLNDYLEKNGINAFLEQDFINLYDNSAAYTGNRDGIKLLVGSPAYNYRYDYGTYEQDEESRWYLLTPTRVLDAVQRFAAAFTGTQVKNAAVGGLGNTLYSDYATNHYMTRTASQRTMEQALEALEESFDSLLVSEGNAYTFRYADMMTDVPATGSHYDIVDTDVPFYQMVLHGLVPMTVPSCNLSSDSRYLYLKAVETGCGLKYTWIADDPQALMETAYNNLFGVGFAEWFDEAVAQYQLMEKDLSALSTLQITEHQEVASQVFKTTYEDGSYVIVNYNETAVDYAGVSIDARSYHVFTEGR